MEVEVKVERSFGKRVLPGLMIAAAILAACGKAPHQDERYFLVASDTALPYWQEANAGFMSAVGQLGFGVKAEMVGPDTYSASQELDAFNQAVAAHPAGILVSPADAKLFKDPIDRAVKQGIPVICIDSDAPESSRLMFVGTDNYRAGSALGTRLAEALHGEGSVVVLTVQGPLSQDERLRGVKDAFAHYPKIKIEQVLDDQGDPRKANDQIADLIAKKAKMDGILSLDASGGPGSAEALHRLNLDGKVPVVAMDKDQETLGFISSGAIVASVAQKPYTMAFYGLRFLDDLHHNAVHEFSDWRAVPASPLPTLVDTGISIVDKDNLQAYQEAEKGYTKSGGSI
jgi:ribose transport system substrate-binding protein